MDNKKLIIGVDIGGSKINIIVWDGQKVVDSWRTNEVSLKNLKRGISYFNISKVGIGVAGVLDYKTGCILDSPNLKLFEGLCLKKFLNKKVRFDNDVNCFLRAEAKLGSAKGSKNVLAVAMGTGIGGAIIINKKTIYLGSHGSAGEFGFMTIKDGKTWEKLYQETKDKDKEQKQIHALGFANLINIFDPEIIVLGGDGAILPNQKLMKKFILSPLAKKTQIISGKLGLNAVAIGAALLWSGSLKKRTSLAP
ncbi:ROK family protein [Patescibacteria group bacterium]|nr:ROK family protein [Patescibacteria group bacterium]